MKTKLQQMIEIFNEEVAGIWDLPSGVCPYFETKDGQIFVGGYYIIPQVSRIVDRWITVRGMVKMQNEETGEWIILPAVFEFQWNDKGEEWKLESWDFARKKDREKYSPVF